MRENTRRFGLLIAIAVSLLASASPASAELYIYVDTWAAEYPNSDETVTVYGSATAESDQAFMMTVTMTQKDPSGNVLAYRSRRGQWSVTAQTESHLAIDGSPNGNYQAIGTASQPGADLHIGCNTVQFGKDAYRHHYSLKTMGNPNVYRLHEDSYVRECSKLERTWYQGGANLFMTDSGLAFSFFGRPIACVGICQGGFFGSVIGPSGNPGNQGPCDKPQ